MTIPRPDPREALAIAGDVVRLVALIVIVFALWVATPGDPNGASSHRDVSTLALRNGSSIC